MSRNRERLGEKLHQPPGGLCRRARVRDALKTLPAPQREALTLAYFGGYTQREIAGLTDAPLGTVKSRMLTGMRSLRCSACGDPDL